MHFNLNNKSNKFYNFIVYKLKVNDYVMYIWYNDLKNNNIDKNEIKKFSFILLLYTSERGDTSFIHEENDDYLEIELK